jgi:hypothetical protein
MKMSSAVHSSAVCCFHPSQLFGTKKVDLKRTLPGFEDLTIDAASQCPLYPDCNIHYTPQRGYFGAGENEPIVPGGQGNPSCHHEDETFYMFLMHENDVLVWACPIDGCDERVQPSETILSRIPTAN